MAVSRYREDNVFPEAKAQFYEQNMLRAILRTACPITGDQLAAQRHFSPLTSARNTGARGP